MSREIYDIIHTELNLPDDKQLKPTDRLYTLCAGTGLALLAQELEREFKLTEKSLKLDLDMTVDQLCIHVICVQEIRNGSALRRHPETKPVSLPIAA